MRINNRCASLLFKAIIVVVGCLALSDQLGFFVGSFRTSFFHFFTNLSNLVAVVYFVGAIVHSLRQGASVNTKCSKSEGVWMPAWKYAATMAVVVTWLVSHFLMGGGGAFGEHGVNLSVLALHYLVPIATLLDWLLFDEKGNMSRVGPLIWMIFPLVYFGYVITMVNVLGVTMHGFGTGRYPYPFIDIDQLGIGDVAMNSFFLLIAFVALGYLFVGIDRLLARIPRKRAQALPEQ